MRLRRPTFQERCRYAGKKVGLAKMLRRAALLHHGLIPRDVLCGDEEGANVQRLVTYGILEEIPGKKESAAVFRIDPMDHRELIKLFRVEHYFLKRAENGDILAEPDAENHEDFEILPRLCLVTWVFFAERRIDRAVRTANRLGLLVLLFWGLLPPFPLSVSQEWVVAVLNIFLFAAVLTFACI